MPLQPGIRLGPYEVLSALGAGGMGDVWKARDTRLNRIVAIKQLKGEHSARFEQEARAIAAPNHPHICTLYDIGPDYLVMEYIDGASPRGPVAAGDAVRWATQIAGALEAAHQHGILHRDLKPANVLISGGSAKLLDFGLATQTHHVERTSRARAKARWWARSPTCRPSRPRANRWTRARRCSASARCSTSCWRGPDHFPANSAADVMTSVLRDNVERAADFMARAIEERYPGILFFVNGPVGAALRASARWPALKHMMHLPEPA